MISGDQPTVGARVSFRDGGDVRIGKVRSVGRDGCKIDAEPDRRRYKVLHSDMLAIVGATETEPAEPEKIGKAMVLVSAADRAAARRVDAENQPRSAAVVKADSAIALFFEGEGQPSVALKSIVADAPIQGLLRRLRQLFIPSKNRRNP